MKLTKNVLSACIGAVLALSTASGSAAPVKGADVSWMSEIEANGISFYNRSGVKKDILAIMKEQGMMLYDLLLISLAFTFR